VVDFFMFFVKFDSLLRVISFIPSW
jgi:hypothetical protein